MALSDRQMLDALSRMPFVESTELALILGEPHATVCRRLSELLSGGIRGAGEPQDRTSPIERETLPGGR